MAEGPQVKLRAEWLDRHLRGRTVCTAEALVEAVGSVLRESYGVGGRWNCAVYHKAGRPCPRCGEAIRRIVQGAQKRSTFFCPRCQGGNA